MSRRLQEESLGGLDYATPNEAHGELLNAIDEFTGNLDRENLTAVTTAMVATSAAVVAAQDKSDTDHACQITGRAPTYYDQIEVQFTLPEAALVLFVGALRWVQTLGADDHRLFVGVEVDGDIAWTDPGRLGCERNARGVIMARFLRPGVHYAHIGIAGESGQTSFLTIDGGHLVVLARLR